MTRPAKAQAPVRAPALLIVVLLLLCRSNGIGLQPGSVRTVTGPAAVFDMDGRQIIQDEDHLGIANGKMTVGINYRDVAGLAGLWTPPYVSSNFMLDGRVHGEKVRTVKWTWRPFQCQREGSVGSVAVSSTTTLIYGHRAAVVSFAFKNSSRTAAPIELFSLGSLDRTQNWGFTRPASSTETTLEAEGRRLTFREGGLALIVAIDSEAWNWEVSGNLGHASASLAPGQMRLVNVIIGMGPVEELEASISRILSDPLNAVSGANQEYARQVNDVFDRLPSLESDNAQLVRWYNRSLVPFLLNRWDVPEFVLHPYYSTGSIKGGCLANYLWNFGEAWEILPLFDPSAARNHIRQFLKCDLLKHFLFNPITGQADGVWYMINQEKIIGLTYYYVLLTGDKAFLHEVVDGRSVRDHMVVQAMFGDEVGKPMSLIDYGESNSHLELRRGYAYNHVMPALNARRYANYLRAATLCDLAGKPASVLSERAELLKPLLKERLWDPRARWFRFEDGKGKSGLRYTVQLFKPIGTGGFDRECEEGLLSHLNEEEFLSAYGLHSISKRDPAYDQLDIDNGGGGICTSFPPQIIERLYRAGKPKLAADVLRRLLWWADTMPYWGDSLAANCKDYRRDTPLQCAFDGVAGAQCIIFGVFGVEVKPDGDVVIKPNHLPLASRLTLKGLKVRGHAMDIQMANGRYEVRSGGHTVTALLGQTTVLASKSGTLRVVDGAQN